MQTTKIKEEDLDNSKALEQCRLALLKAEKHMLKEDPMTVWLQTKEHICNIFKQSQTAKKTLRTRGVCTRENTLKQLKGSRHFLHNSATQQEVQKIESEIDEIKRAKLDAMAPTSAVQYRLKGESSNKYTFTIGKKPIEEQTIKSLKDAEGQAMTSSQQMADVAATHHQRLQARPDMTPEWEAAIQKMAGLASQ